MGLLKGANGNYLPGNHLQLFHNGERLRPYAFEIDDTTILRAIYRSPCDTPLNTTVSHIILLRFYVFWFKGTVYESNKI